MGFHKLSNNIIQKIRNLLVCKRPHLWYGDGTSGHQNQVPLCGSLSGNAASGAQVSMGIEDSTAVIQLPALLCWNIQQLPAGGCIPSSNEAQTATAGKRLWPGREGTGLSLAWCYTALKPITRPCLCSYYNSKVSIWSIRMQV